MPKCGLFPPHCSFRSVVCCGHGEARGSVDGTERSWDSPVKELTLVSAGLSQGVVPSFLFKCGHREIGHRKIYCFHSRAGSQPTLNPETQESEQQTQNESIHPSFMCWLPGAHSVSLRGVYDTHTNLFLLYLERPASRLWLPNQNVTCPWPAHPACSSLWDLASCLFPIAFQSPLFSWALYPQTGHLHHTQGESDPGTHSGTRDAPLAFLYTATGTMLFCCLQSN